MSGRFGMVWISKTYSFQILSGMNIAPAGDPGEYFREEEARHVALLSPFVVQITEVVEQLRSEAALPLLDFNPRAQSGATLQFGGFHWNSHFHREWSMDNLRAGMTRNVVAAYTHPRSRPSEPAGSRNSFTPRSLLQPMDTFSVTLTATDDIDRERLDKLVTRIAEILSVPQPPSSFPPSPSTPPIAPDEPVLFARLKRWFGAPPKPAPAPAQSAPPPVQSAPPPPPGVQLVRLANKNYECPEYVLWVYPSASFVDAAYAAELQAAQGAAAQELHDKIAANLDKIRADNSLPFALTAEVPQRIKQHDSRLLQINLRPRGGSAILNVAVAKEEMKDSAQAWLHDYFYQELAG